MSSSACSSLSSPFSSFSFSANSSSSSSVRENLSIKKEALDESKSNKTEDKKSVQKTMFCYQQAKGVCQLEHCNFMHEYKNLTIKRFSFPYKVFRCSERRTQKPCPGDLMCTYLHDDEFVVVETRTQLSAVYKQLEGDHYFLLRFFSIITNIHPPFIKCKNLFPQKAVVSHDNVLPKMTLEQLKQVSSFQKKPQKSHSLQFLPNQVFTHDRLPQPQYVGQQILVYFPFPPSYSQTANSTTLQSSSSLPQPQPRSVFNSNQAAASESGSGASAELC